MKKDTVLIILLVLVAAIAAGAYYFLRGGEDQSQIVSSNGTTTESGEPSTSKPLINRARPNAPVAPKAAPAQTNAMAEAVGGAVSGAATISGTVFDADNAPLANAYVTLCEDVSDVPAYTLQGKILATTSTDEKGNFTIDPVAVEFRYVLRVDHDEFASKSVPEADFSRGEKRNVAVRLARGLAVAGNVADKEGKPLANATVGVYDQASRSLDPDDQIERKATTDAEGNFTVVGLNPGFKRVVASAPGFAASTNPSVFIADGKITPPLSFRLEEGGHISGVVKDTKTGPVEGVLIVAEPIRRSGSNVVQSYPPVKSNADGTFVYEGLAPGHYMLTCHKKGYQNTGVRKDAEVGQEDVVIEMEKNPVARGQVVDAETGQPIKRFSIEMGRGETYVFRSNRLSQRFETEDGRFEYVCDMNSGDVFFYADAMGYAASKSGKYTVVPQQDLDGIVIKMGKGATVVGRVTSSKGGGIAGADVEVMPLAGAGPPNPFIELAMSSMRTAGKRSRTDAEGNYKVEGVQEGTFRVKASHPSFAAAESEQSFTVPERGEVTAPVLSLMAGGTFKGIVYDKEKKPEPRTKVQLTEQGKFGGVGSYFAITDEKGRFEIKNVRPGVYKTMITERKGEPNADLFANLLLGQKNQTTYLIEDGGVVEVELD